MLIQSARRKSDPITMFGILARAALERFDIQDEPVRLRNVYFNNLIRLLEMYRYDALREHNTQGILDRHELVDAEGFFNGNESGIEVLDEILREAHTDFYPNLDKKGLVDHLRVVLEQIRHEGSGSIEASELEKLQSFLTKIEKITSL